jgi:hypothetical protein
VLLLSLFLLLPAAATQGTSPSPEQSLPLDAYLASRAAELGGADLVGLLVWVYRHDKPRPAVGRTGTTQGTWCLAEVTGYTPATSEHLVSKAGVVGGCGGEGGGHGCKGQGWAGRDIIQIMHSRDGYTRH